MSEQNSLVVKENHITIFSSFLTRFPTHSRAFLVINCVHASNWFTHLQQMECHNDFSLLLCMSRLDAYISRYDDFLQTFALRVCTKEWSMSYKDLLEKCHVSELSTRRDHLSLGLLHKINNGECILPNAPLLTYSTTYSTRSNVANLIDMSCLLRIPICSRGHIFIVQ